VAGFQIAEHLQRQVHRNAGHANLAFADRRVCAHVLCCLEAFLKDAVKDRSGRSAPLCGGVGVLHLSEDLRLPDHLGINAGRDFKKVLHRRAIAQSQPDLLENGELDLVDRAKRRLETIHGTGIGGHTVDLDAVAGVEDGELPQAGERTQDGLKLGKLAAGEREFLPQLDRSGVVGGSEQEKPGRGLGTHVLVADAGAAGATG
jgi:hypothetical protein